MSLIELPRVEPGSWRKDTLTTGVEPAQSLDKDIFATDHYEILRLSPQADEETIERVYSTLAGRFDPENPSTGDPETFLRVREAYQTLSNPARRAQYNVLRQRARGSARFRLRGREFFDGVRGEQNRRLAALCLLYRQRISTHESPGLTLLDLEQSTGCTREELASALWYLCEKKWATLGEFTEYRITADGFDIVESRLEERREFRALATLRYYSSPPESECSVYSASLADVSHRADQTGANLEKLVNAVERLCNQRAPEPAPPTVHENQPSRRSRITLTHILIAAFLTFIGTRFVR